MPFRNFQLQSIKKEPLVGETKRSFSVFT